MYKGIEAREIEGLSIFTKDDVDYTNVIGASCPCNSILLKIL